MSLLGAGCSTSLQDRDVSNATDLKPDAVGLLEKPRASTASKSSVATSTEPVWEEVRDAHNCVESAGFRWCEPRQACIQFLEAPCYATPEEAIRYTLAERLRTTPAQIVINLTEFAITHAKGYVRRVGDDQEAPLLFLVSGSEESDRWELDYLGNGPADCAVLQAQGYPAAMLMEVCQGQ